MTRYDSGEKERKKRKTRCCNLTLAFLFQSGNDRSLWLDPFFSFSFLFFLLRRQSCRSETSTQRLDRFFKRQFQTISRLLNACEYEYERSCVWERTSDSATRTSPYLFGSAENVCRGQIYGQNRWHFASIYFSWTLRKPSHMHWEDAIDIESVLIVMHGSLRSSFDVQRKSSTRQDTKKTERVFTTRSMLSFADQLFNDDDQHPTNTIF